MNLHVHVYDENSEADDNLIDEFDLEPTGEYPDLDSHDLGYKQFGFERNGEYFEIRVPYKYISE